MEDIHSLLARMGSKRGFKQWENSTGASSDELPALGGDSLDWDEMPQVGSSFHRSLIGNRIEDWEMENLDTLIGSESDDSFFPLDGSDDDQDGSDDDQDGSDDDQDGSDDDQDGSDDDRDGSVHYY